ncbi:MAG: dephospho-CoA kinase [Caulobacterales bacterium]
MKIVGLTGSIGMGKSATSEMFRGFGVPVYDADAAVHGFYAKGGAAVPLVQERFPEAVVDGAVDRTILSKLVVREPKLFQELQNLVMPLVGKQRREFLEREREKGTPIVVDDIPLLYELGSEKNYDKIVVVSAPAEMQRERVLARPGMSVEKFEAILARQMPDAEKRKRADAVIDTSQGFEHARAQVKAFLDEISEAA